MTATRDLLVEIGTEELPPKALRQMRDALRRSLDTLLDENSLAHGKSHAYATPRRLAVLIRDVPVAQPDRKVTRRGPALKAAFDGDGNPTRPAEGFANSCGVTVGDLEKLETDKGSWLVYHSIETGQATADIIPTLLEKALKSLPMPKRMRWGNSDIEFVRPLHWMVLLFGEQPVSATVLGIDTDRHSYGHRFHHNEPITITSPENYAGILEQQGMVETDMDQRRESIRTQVTEAAIALGGEALIDAALLDEVTALVEWPVAISGSYDPRFLSVPAEALISSMQDHQKYFPVVDRQGKLLPHFITVANIASKDPDQIRIGNERVIRPRLEDAVFFWNQDRKQSLHSRVAQLHGMAFQKGLGSLGDKQERIARIATSLAASLGFDTERVERAASLCKCDLVTSMVFEFPELQGIMGRYYALHDGENAQVAAALDEQYQPRFAGDTLPASETGQALAIAERLDTLVGIFAIGQTPTGDKDPFGLRRSALGLLRILIEKHLDLDLRTLIDQAAGNFPAALGADTIGEALFSFMMDRLRAWYVDAGYEVHVFEAVLARQPLRPLDFDERMRAVRAFRELPEADSLSAANKRIRNILRKASTVIPATYQHERLQEPAEQALAAALELLDAQTRPLFQQRDYTNALRRLAALQTPVDDFFDNVMVMADDDALRDNRLALLQALSDLFLQVADISLLQG
ncbi:MAG: glycine--tRNA ligase subunit beta [Gammaproteobacteria bacterium]|jgi:glycyl-tRNA synthetase beta chain|nr:glycine--tRNA ligase subunit beta [Gammaproteobacteria bacterium]